jgi:hypothetical protein
VKLYWKYYVPQRISQWSGNSGLISKNYNQEVFDHFSADVSSIFRKKYQRKSKTRNKGKIIENILLKL